MTAAKQAQQAPVYDPDRTTMQQAAVRCGLRVKRGTHINCVLIDDTTGALVFEGQRWPDAWDFMRSQRGLTAQEASHG